MATITHLPFSLSFSSFLYRKPLFYYRYHQQPQLFTSYVDSSKNCGFVCFACSGGQTRVRKKVKSNEELRSEIMEFVALVGLPEGYVPSMKELSEHGRVDLANIVRRRGYKFIKGLLSNSDIEDQTEVPSETETDATPSATSIYLEDPPTGQGNGAVDLYDGNLYERVSRMEVYLTATDGSLSCDKEINNFLEESVVTSSSPESEEHERVNKDESSLAGISSVENCLSSSDGGMHLQVGEITYSGEITGDDLKIESVEINNATDINTSSSEVSVSANHDLVLDDSSYSAREADNVLMIEDEEANDVDGYVSLSDDALAYDHYTSPDFNYTSHGDIATESLSALTSEDTIAIGENFQNHQMDDTAEVHFGSADHSLLESGDKDRVLGISSSSSSIEEKTRRFIQNGFLDTVDDDDNDRATESCLEESKENPETEGGDSYFSHRSMSTAPNGSALALEEVTHTTSSFDRNSEQHTRIADTDKDLPDETMKREIQVEITRLRFLLRQKELELLKLKEQIEKEKLSFSVLQRQAETEINKAQMLISEKDVELQAAEENLSGLQEVEIDFCGDGNVVEMMGSFNGWQHRVEMELQPSKSTGKQKCWSTLLWLYPGTYEIKFIVDGHWMTDPQKDSVTRGHITNNILKVDRCSS